jgi:hypothetical protein
MKYLVGYVKIAKWIHFKGFLEKVLELFYFFVYDPWVYSFNERSVKLYSDNLIELIRIIIRYVSCVVDDRNHDSYRLQVALDFFHGTQTIRPVGFESRVCPSVPSRATFAILARVRSTISGFHTKPCRTKNFWDVNSKRKSPSVTREQL